MHKITTHFRFIFALVLYTQIQLDPNPLSLFYIILSAMCTKLKIAMFFTSSITVLIEMTRVIVVFIVIMWSLAHCILP